jgi:DeoR/GlpR family transcriptional regulator of sugar metabolism
MNTKQEYRRQRILNAMQEGILTARAIADKLGVTPQDINNDFAILESRGKIFRKAKISHSLVWELKHEQ